MSLRIDVSKEFKDFKLNIQIDTKEGWLGLLGASGSGKSVTLKLIAGIITPDRGSIILNDRILFDSERKINLPPQERKVGYLFQSYALFPNMTVEENITFVLKGDKEYKRKRALELIELFRLKGLERVYPRELSGGQQQRAALARIIASQAEMLLLDEPFSALDDHLREELIEEFIPLMKELKKDVLLVTHDREEIYRLSQELAIIDKGRIIRQGETKEVFNSPGNLMAASLVGINNISAMERLSDYEVHAKDWGFHLRLEEKAADNIKYLGIASNSIKSLRIRSNHFSNFVSCELIKVIERTNDILLVVRNKNAQGSLEWRISKEKWHKEFNCSLPESLYLPPEDLVLLEE